MQEPGNHAKSSDQHANTHCNDYIYHLLSLLGHHPGLVFKVNFDSLSGVPKPIKPSILLPNAFLGNFSVSGFSQKNSPLPYIPDLLNLAFALVVILQKSHSLHFGIIYFTSQLLHSMQRILLLHKVLFIIDSLGQVGWTYTISSPTLLVLCLQVLYFSSIASAPYRFIQFLLCVVFQCNRHTAVYTVQFDQIRGLIRKIF